MLESLGTASSIRNNHSNNNGSAFDQEYHAHVNEIIRHVEIEKVVMDAEGDDGDDHGQGRAAAVSSRRRQNLMLLGILFVSALIGLITVLAVVLPPSSASTAVAASSNNGTASASPNTTTGGTENSSNQWAPTNSSTLQRIQERGYLRCSSAPRGYTEGLCQAITAAIFGGAGDLSLYDAEKHLEVVITPWFEVWKDLETGLIDLSIDGTTFTMSRDIYGPWQGTAPHPGTFSTPFLYTGTRFYGIPEFVDCADRMDSLNGTCRDLAVCVPSGTTTELVVKQLLDGSQHVLDTNYVNGSSQYDRGVYAEFIAGNCNVFATVGILEHEDNLRNLHGYTASFRSSDELHSKEPLSIMTREGDNQFGDFVQWVLHALITAEAMNISQQQAQSFPTTTALGPQYENMFQNAIAAVGNMGELWNRTLGRRPLMNTINNGTTGLMYSFPFGDTTLVPTTTTKASVVKPSHGHNRNTLEIVADRNEVRCGIVGDRPGFAIKRSSNATTNVDESIENSHQWNGIDIDFCCGIAAALFAQDQGHIVLVELANLSAGFQALGQGEIDLLAGAPFTLENDIKEQSTGQGFSFGPIYYFSNEQLVSLASREEDVQWSDFLRWITFATIYAEEEGIGADTAFGMPLLELYGSSYKQAFRDLIFTVGNYGEIYERNLENYVRRSGRNLLNNANNPQFFPLTLTFY